MNAIRKMLISLTHTVHLALVSVQMTVFLVCSTMFGRTMILMAGRMNFLIVMALMPVSRLHQTPLPGVEKVCKDYSPTRGFKMARLKLFTIKWLIGASRKVQKQKKAEMRPYSFVAIIGNQSRLLFMNENGDPCLD